jgi:hypothetical protein
VIAANKSHSSISLNLIFHFAERGNLNWSSFFEFCFSLSESFFCCFCRERSKRQSRKSRLLPPSLPPSLPLTQTLHVLLCLSIIFFSCTVFFSSLHHSKIRDSLTSSKISLLKSIKMTKKNFIKKNYCDQLFFLPQNPRPVGDPEVLGDERTNWGGARKCKGMKEQTDWGMFKFG